MMRRHFLRTRTLLLAGTLLLCLDGMRAAYGAISLGATRVIMDGQKGEAVVRLESKGDAPVLIQAWLDRGDPDEDPAHIRIPFLVTHPVFRLEAKDSQLLHIVHTASSGENSLPAGRESVFWLNVLEVPAAAPPEPGMVRLQMAATSRIKFFYRPPGLDVEMGDAVSSLQFALLQDAPAPQLEALNPSPLHVTLTRMVLHGCSNSRPLLEIRPQDSMIAPGQRRVFAAPSAAAALASAENLCMDFHYLDDYGTTVGQRATSPIHRRSE